MEVLSLASGDYIPRDPECSDDSHQFPALKGAARVLHLTLTGLAWGRGVRLSWMQMESERQQKQAGQWHFVSKQRVVSCWNQELEDVWGLMRTHAGWARLALEGGGIRAWCWHDGVDWVQMRALTSFYLPNKQVQKLFHFQSWLSLGSMLDRRNKLGQRPLRNNDFWSFY